MLQSLKHNCRCPTAIFSPTLKPLSAQNQIFHLLPALPLLLPYHQTRPATIRNAYRALPAPTNIRLRDEDIKSQFVQVVSETTNKLLPPEPPSSILKKIDRKSYFLVECVKPTPDIPYSICKIVDKREAREFEKNKARPIKSLDSTKKILQLSWSTEDHDFQRKIELLGQFIAEGRRVTLLLEKKKKGRSAEPQDPMQAIALIDKLLDCVKGLEGAREYRQREGEVGKKMIFYFEMKGRENQNRKEEPRMSPDAMASVKSLDSIERKAKWESKRAHKEQLLQELAISQPVRGTWGQDIALRLQSKGPLLALNPEGTEQVRLIWWRILR